MPSLRALYQNFKTDFGSLLEVTDFSIPTWLALGATFQLLSQSYLTPGPSHWLPLLYLVYRVAKVAIDSRRVFSGTFVDVRFGRWSAALPEPGNGADVTETSDGVVLFLLGARINQFVLSVHADSGFELMVFSPLGKLAPGNAEIDTMFKNMWVEAEKNRTKWSCESHYRPFFNSFQTNPFFLACIHLYILIDLICTQISGEPRPYSISRTLKESPPSGFHIGRISRVFRNSQLHLPIVWARMPT